MRYRLQWAVLSVGFCFWSAVSSATDPFYEQLLRKGLATQDRGEHQQAARLLRLACFGMLEEPEALARCLVHLGLSQFALGDRQGFQETFVRVAELEARFAAYGKANLPAETRAAFEKALQAAIPAPTLKQSPGFSHLVPSEEQRVASLPAAQRRRELQRRIADQPRQLVWRCMLAELDLAEGKYKDVLETTAFMLREQPAHPCGLRARGLALARLGRWAEAETALEALPWAQDPELAEALVEALGHQGRWEQLEKVGAALPQATRERPAVQRWLSRSKAQGTAPGPPPTPGASLSKPQPSVEEELGRLRQLLEAGKVQEALALAKQLVGRFPQNRQVLLLAGETAYRGASWKEAVRYYEAVGDLPEASHAFYFAVALFEAGQRERAAQLLRSCLPKVQRTPFVESYVRKILGAEEGSERRKP
jgi:tetratricopeptide (TPR) repeat protein